MKKLKYIHRIAEKLENSMIRIPSGPFKFGITDKEKMLAAKKEKVHPDMLYFHSKSSTLTTREFWIDKYPVTRAQFFVFMRKTGYKFLYCGWQIGWEELVNLYSDLDNPRKLLSPITGVGSQDANAYAKWASKRLPTEIEWEKAARGTDARLYPWGNEFKAVMKTKGIPGFKSSIGIGSRPELDSPYGVCDMKGNVMEWVQSIFTPHSKDGASEDRNPFTLVGSSFLHRKHYSHMASSRFQWSSSMQIYNAGFRCVSDYEPDKIHLGKTRGNTCNQTVYSRPSSYLKKKIELDSYSWPTFKIKVPWFPEGLWVVDIPEGHWGPFPGANDWPFKSEGIWKTDWKRNKNENSIEYSRKKGKRELHVKITAEKDFVRLRVTPVNIGKIHLGSICVKTLNPFFSSQERATQHRIEKDFSMTPVNSLPIAKGTTTSLAWNSCGPLPHGAIAAKAYDNSGYFVMIGNKGVEVFGNGWPHCTHLSGKAMLVDKDTEITLLFMMGNARKLTRRIKELISEKSGLPLKKKWRPQRDSNSCY